MKDEEWHIIDIQVLGIVRLTLSKDVGHTVKTEKITAGLMQVLSDMYEKPPVNNKIHLLKKLFNLKMTKNTPIAKHINEFSMIVNHLASIEIDFGDEVRALILLVS